MAKVATVMSTYLRRVLCPLRALSSAQLESEILFWGWFSAGHAVLGSTPTGVGSPGVFPGSLGSPLASPFQSPNSITPRSCFGPLVIARRKLLGLLEAAMPAGTLQLGHRVAGFREEADGVLLQFQVRCGLSA